jgi:hypothetical protein
MYFGRELQEKYSFRSDISYSVAMVGIVKQKALLIDQSMKLI